MPTAARPPEGHARILIAGQDLPFCRRLRASVEAHEGLEVVGIAEDGKEAIHLVETLKPSLVLMDVAMPGVDGIEATRRIRKLPDSPAVVLMTSDDDEIDDRAVDAGAAAYLRKSSDLIALLDFVVAFAGASARSDQGAAQKSRAAR
ncbi:MAG: response regulator transcription factor [Gaiellaceae bacterium]